MTHPDLLADAHAAAVRYLATLPSRPVRAALSLTDLRASLADRLPSGPSDPRRVLAELAAAFEPGVVASAGPRYFGFVTGGVLPIALAAEWLTATWDQNAFNHVTSPAASALEELCAAWLLELLGLPGAAGVGLVTGGQMANFTCLCAARDEVLRRAGVDLEQTGLAGAPELTVFVSEQAHATIHSALRMLGIGKRQVVTVAADAQGRLRPDALAHALPGRSGPLVVCAQAGNVNTGSFDPLREIAALTREHGAWLHVDGAFGLWAAAHPELRAQLDGYEAADSWAVDAHKWLNVVYDSGIAIVADREAHRRALRGGRAAYLVAVDETAHDGTDWAPESSRRARAIAIYAVLRALGQSGVAELVGRCCALARRFAEGLAREAGATILNDVVLNQVLAHFGDDARTRAILARVQREGTCWAGGSVALGRAVVRISVSNWSTTERDIDASVAAFAAAAREITSSDGSASAAT